MKKYLNYFLWKIITFEKTIIPVLLFAKICPCFSLLYIWNHEYNGRVLRNA